MTERLRRQAEREALLREQAARAEAERVAELVGGMQALVDAALAQRTLDDILRDLVTRCAGCSRRRCHDLPRRRGRAAQRGRVDAGMSSAVREEFAIGWPRRARRCSLRTVQPREGGALIGVPLLAEGEVTGVLVACATLPREFGDEHLTLLRLAAERVALAIAHARVYEREHRIAETLQRSLLPDRLPTLPGLDVAARYQPAASEAEVGGDWYDVIPIAGGAVGW